MAPRAVLGAVSAALLLVLCACSSSDASEPAATSSPPVATSSPTPTPAPTATKPPTATSPPGGYGSRVVYKYDLGTSKKIVVKRGSSSFEPDTVECNTGSTVPVSLIYGLPGEYGSTVITTSVWEQAGSDRTKNDTRILLIDSTKKLDVNVLVAKKSLVGVVKKQKQPAGKSPWRISLALKAFGFSTNQDEQLKQGDIVLCVNRGKS